MKTVSRILSVLMTLTLLLALSVTAVASGEPSASPEASQQFIAQPIRGSSALYVGGGEYAFDGAYFYGAGIPNEEDLSAERSNQYGFCAAVLANSASSVLTLNDPEIVCAEDSYANGVFAANSANIYVNGGTIDTNNSQGHGIDVTYGGKVHVTDTVIHTGGGSSGALASDYGGGFILADGIDCTTESAGSPGIYCAGASVIYCTDSIFRANNCEGVMSAHDHGITVLNNCYTFGEVAALNGHQAMPSAAQSSGSYVFVFGGTLASGSGPIIKEMNGRTETTLVGVSIELADGYENVIEAADENSGILTVNVWDTELVGNVYCGEGAAVTVNLYSGGSLTGEVVGSGDVTINVHEGGTYNGSYMSNSDSSGEPTPVIGDFDYYLTNYWAIGNKWTAGTVTTYVEQVEPVIIENSAVSHVTEGASAVEFDAETYDPSESGVGSGNLNVQTTAISGNPWALYLDYAEDMIRASEEPDFVDQALETLYNESNEKDPDGWPFDMFVESRGLFDSYEDFLAKVFPDALTASEEPTSGGTTWEDYLAYAEAAIRAQEDPNYVDMALDTLYNESNENDPNGWPFDMFVAARSLFVSYEDFQNGAVS